MADNAQNWNNRGQGDGRQHRPENDYARSADHHGQGSPQQQGAMASAVRATISNPAMVTTTTKTGVSGPGPARP